MNIFNVCPVSLRSLALRRAAVVTMYASYVLIGFLYQAGWMLPLALICTMSYVIVIAGTRNYQIRTCARKRLALLDERQAAVRERALSDSYRILSLLFLIMAGTLSLVPQAPPSARPDRWSYIFWLAFLLVSSLPEALIAWNERPVPDPGDELNRLAA